MTRVYCEYCDPKTRVDLTQDFWSTTLCSLIWREKVVRKVMHRVSAVRSPNISPYLDCRYVNSIKENHVAPDEPPFTCLCTGTTIRGTWRIIIFTSGFCFLAQMSLGRSGFWGAQVVWSPLLSWQITDVTLHPNSDSILMTIDQSQSAISRVLSLKPYPPRPRAARTSFVRYIVN